MKFAKKMVVILFLLLVSLGIAACSSTPAASPKPADSGAKPSAEKPAVSEALKKVIEAARQEKGITFFLVSGTSINAQESARRLQELVKKYFDVDVSITADDTPTYVQIPPKLIAEAQAKAPATYDLIYQVDGTIAPLYQADLLQTVDWTGLFNWIRKEDVFWDSKGVVVASMPTLPAYNTKLVSQADLPKKWTDLADPKWKGKMIAPSYQTVMTRLAQPDVLGEEKATEFVKKLATQEMAFGRYPDMFTRQAAGEFSLATNQLLPYLVQAQRQGAPVAAVPLDDSIVVQDDVLAIPKHAQHPNAAMLVAAVLLTDEAQKLWDEGYGRSSLRRPNTPVSEWAKGKKMSFADKNFVISKQSELDKQYSNILIKK